MGPNIEPCGIPDKSIWKALSVPFIFTPCFPRFKYEYTWSLAERKLWGIPPKALERSPSVVFISD